MDKTHQIYLARYAKLIVHYGLSIVPGQYLVISAEPCHSELSRLICTEAYLAGAKFVEVRLTDPRTEKIRIENSQEEYLDFVPTHLKAKLDDYIDEQIAYCAIDGSEYPNVLNGLDSEKLLRLRKANYQVSKDYQNQAINQNFVQWTIAAGATEAWAEKVFPDSEQALDQLWEQIFKICRVDLENFLELWQQHDEILKARCQKLNQLDLEKIVFSGPGTDLSVGLSKHYQFIGGRSKSKRDQWFEPNLPTEECFTTPDYHQTNGTVSVTRDFRLYGQLISGLKLSFKDGIIANCSASEGEAAFKKFLTADAGANRLGELALVGVDSPIFQSGLFFDKVLFDENAACHIAIGSAYKNCIRDAENLDAAELEIIGVNESMIHQDMMISDQSVSVIGISRDGSQTQLLSDGKWADNFL